MTGPSVTLDSSIATAVGESLDSEGSLGGNESNDLPLGSSSSNDDCSIAAPDGAAGRLQSSKASRQSDTGCDDANCTSVIDTGRDSGRKLTTCHCGSNSVRATDQLWRLL